MEKASAVSPPSGGIDVQSHRQGGGGGVQGVEETHQCHAEACRIQQGSALPHDAADGQNTAGDDAVHRSRQHYGTDHVHLPAPSASAPSR